MSVTPTHIMITDTSEQLLEFSRFGTREQEQADEREWQSQFAASGDFLEELAAEARSERRLGKTLPLDSVLELAAYDKRT